MTRAEKEEKEIEIIRQEIEDSCVNYIQNGLFCNKCAEMINLCGIYPRKAIKAYKENKDKSCSKA